MWPFRRPRIHESVAISAVFAMAIALNVFWILNLLSSRLVSLKNTLTLVESVGPVTGLYLSMSLVFIVLWLIFLAFFRGRDCEPYREKAFWFYFVSVMAFIVLTFPPVYSLAMR